MGHGFSFQVTGFVCWLLYCGDEDAVCNSLLSLCGDGGWYGEGTGSGGGGCTTFGRGAFGVVQRDVGGPVEALAGVCFVAWGPAVRRMQLKLREAELPPKSIVVSQLVTVKPIPDTRFEPV